MKQIILDYFDKFIPLGGVALEIGDEGGGYTPEIARRLGEGGQLVVFAADEGVARDVGEAMEYRDVADNRPSSEVYCVDTKLSPDKRLDDLELSDLHFVKIGGMYSPHMVMMGMIGHIKRFHPIILFATPGKWNGWINLQSKGLLKYYGYKLYVSNDGALLEVGDNIPREEMLAIYCGN